ncbi:mannitol 2-dehydrogenase [Paraglaciecola arctica BSs20135]|uniref:Mannitol 2-dehydrogenase n=1 Tax=Paraglaciecola arctica BSs20135 TaxID=493475 RepID=K6XHG0_9ALTE|nr:PfkB family carbohydrate kinase [Paraglaciecola arctica]GAC20099.1 mannitol 2-dehydrogenase [Paraglaciecola arctica BSs20135]
MQSCDNIQHNGAVTRKMLLTFAKQQDPQLSQWIVRHVEFPNAMVDRIPPVTTKADIDHVEQTFGLKDEWPITCESFSQWVIEDNFSNGRPNWDLAGAQFVTDVTPYEKTKIRLLNAGHSALGLLGSIHGYATIDETVFDKDFSEYLRAFMDLKVTPLLDKLDGIDLNHYKDTLIERFSNPNIKDSMARICSESSAKLPKFLITTIHENLAADRDCSLAALVIATWCLYSDKQIMKITLEQNLEFIAAKTNTPYMCVTKGSHGALLKINDKNYYNSGYLIKVLDTVGAGDSFLGSLIYQLCTSTNAQYAVDFACAVGAMVAQHNGATPELFIADIEQFINPV